MGKFGTGGKKARVESEKALPAFKRANYLRMEDGESITVRLIDGDEDWIFVDQHGFVPTKGNPDFKPKDGGKQWPSTMNAVCRYSKVDGNPVFDFDDCYICDHMTKDGKRFPKSIKLWARAVVRERVIGTDAMVEAKKIKASQKGQVISFVDKMVEIEETDAEGNRTGSKKEPEVVILNFGMKNFFGALLASAETYGTVRDRDYRITRRGKDLKTEYDIVAEEPIKRYERDDENKVIFDETGDPKVTVYSLDDPETYEKYAHLVDLEKIIDEQASDRHYETFFDPTKPIPGNKKKDTEDDAGGETEEVAKTAPATAEPAAKVEVDQDRLAAMKAKMMNSKAAAKDEA
jgi:hypothetical protein